MIVAGIEKRITASISISIEERLVISVGRFSPFNAKFVLSTGSGAEISVGGRPVRGGMVKFNSGLIGVILGAST